jgi:hypothetical protein
VRALNQLWAAVSKLMISGTSGGGASAVPPGGVAGQFLKKNSPTNYDDGWAYTPYCKGAAWDSGGALTSSPVVAAGASLVLGVAQSAGTIKSCTIATEGSGSVVIEVWKSFAGSIPTSANRIGTAALYGGSYSLDTVLSGWLTSVTAGDVFAFRLVSSSVVTWVSIVLTIG